MCRIPYASFFRELADLPQEERKKILTERRIAVDLRTEVESLLCFDSSSDKSLSQPVSDMAKEMLHEADRLEPRYCGAFRLVRLLGSGGMGTVYLAERCDGEIEQRVAIKLLRADSDRPEWRDRFLRERQLLAYLNHPSIARLLDAGHTDDRRPYLVMEYVDGVAIDEYAASLDVPAKLKLFLVVCDGVSHAHRHFIIHRDLKPSNILVDSAGHPKLLDFGIAKLINVIADKTQTVERLLTPNYASPEQLRGDTQTAATDIYSLGAVLYKLLAGVSPRESSTAMNQTAAEGNNISAPKRLKSDLPCDIDYILQKALHDDPCKRYASVDTFADDIRAILDSRPLQARADDAFLIPVELRGDRDVSDLPNAPLDARLQRGPARRRIALYATSLSLLVLACVWLMWSKSTMSKGASSYTRLTEFTDSVIAPALSPDGRTVVFVRGADWFLSQGQIWLKRLPNGEPIQLTRDPRPKFAPVFSPDGTQVAYSVIDLSKTTWNTLAVPVTGGEPQLMMSNAEGLTWISKHQLLFSEIKTGLHMAVVTARENRSEARDVYVPEHERAMAHFSYASPDRKWVLIIEMDHTVAWQPCRLVPFDGSSRGRQVGPQGRCTSAGWSPDGKWMYFTVASADGQHVWRQRFPQGLPEQLTFGPAEAQGVAVAPDGRSLITSLGMQQSAIWFHDSLRERPISTEGNASTPNISADGKRVFYLLRRSVPDTTNELWAADLDTGRSESLIPGFQITSYDISDSGTEVVFAARPERGHSQIWLASPRRRSSPVLVASAGEDSPFFGPDGQILFRLSDGKANYLYRMNQDGSGRGKIVPYPISNVISVSPDRLWVSTLAPVNDALANVAEIAIPTKGGAAKRICAGFCVARWAPDGKFLYVAERASGFHSEKETIAIPIPAGMALPELPVSGIRSLEDGLALSGAIVIGSSDFAPGLNPSSYAYVKLAMQRNLFRIPIP